VTRSLTVELAAWDELEAALAWYENQDANRQLGIALSLAFEDALARIAEAPERHPRWREAPRFRRCLLDSFPFAVFFEADADHVRVFAFAHTSRRPGYWRDR